uniref:Uncharacterized protein n=1 Tax=Tanacetum cinerariifolium TaxID=118510 RepID=A0A699KZ13_TANCI|nr:hypothetical protein [Tanacetum cinerariifolium]
MRGPDLRVFWSFFIAAEIFLIHQSHCATSPSRILFLSEPCTATVPRTAFFLNLVLPFSEPRTAILNLSSAAATWQLPIGQPSVTWQPRQRRPTPATVSQRRSTPPTTSQRRRSTTVAGGEPPLTAAGPPLTTTSQRWSVGRSTSGPGPGPGRVWIGYGSGLPRGMPRVSNVCTRVSHVCPRGIHVALTWIICTRCGSNATPLGCGLSQNQENHCTRQWSQ